MIVAKPATFSRRLFTAGTLGASAIWIGLVEGIGEGTALIAKVFSGVVADRFGHKKRLVFAGYFLGVVSKPVWNWDVGAEFRISIKKARITRPAPLI